MASISTNTVVNGLAAYLAVPSGEGPWPALVLVHESFGLDENMRRHADRMAAAGYLTLAPDLFDRGPTVTCLIRTFATLRSGRGPAFDDVEAARAQLLADPRCSGRVGVIGFCLGGGFALVLAGRPGWDAAVANYGDLPRDGDAFDGACPVVASYGGRDRYLAGSAATLSERLTDAGVAHDVEEYPRAGHSFLNELDLTPWFTVPVSRFLLHAGPDPDAAAHAWARIDTFLAEHLADAPSAPTMDDGSGDA